MYETVGHESWKLCEVKILISNINEQYKSECLDCYMNSFFKKMSAIMIDQLEEWSHQMGLLVVLLNKYTYFWSTHYIAI